MTDLLEKPLALASAWTTPDASAATRPDASTDRRAPRHPAIVLLRRPGVIVAVAIVAFAILTAIWPGLFATYDPTATEPAARLSAPSLAHWFGTDELGRDLYSRVVHGSTLTIAATALAIGIALVVGLTLGILSGFVGGAVDSVAMRIVDVFLAIPGLLLALAIVTALGFGTLPVAIAVGVGIVPGFARTTRAEVLRVKTLPYIEAARAGGASWTRVLVTHVLPNSWGPVAVLAVLDFGAAILAVAALSFLGFGAAPPAAEWGTLISAGRNYLVTAPWVSLLPGLFVAAVVLSLNHLAKSFEEIQR
ncbi:MAG: ABC transporter permease [Microbacterium sp. SCN 70-200]|uniref:ABC transporter permease n=1 Tax=unclassified Microbacterium TaxID=2609290 RepID=UPI00086C6107|nr:MULTISPECIES: ABC transporter permease [unclassified Microbacterium]MBN9215297.1 ABC transporter permease [Microbacterium sp.]ODT42699.1 MAG: ABC transporter permease [Microbacterium sp. SCN 70-200]OJV79958.1 MAG: ABC transporter permease [Microbacterium sp. 70-16]